MSTAWPHVVNQLLTMLPTLSGWSGVRVYDTNPTTSDAPASYAVVGRTSTDDTSGSYVHMLHPNARLVDEIGTVRVHIVTRTGDVDPAGMRTAAFALLDAFEAATDADQTLGGVLGEAGTVNLTVDVLSPASSAGVAQSLVVSVNYTALI